jgi:hypothetical protein
MASLILLVVLFLLPLPDFHLFANPETITIIGCDYHGCHRWEGESGIER